MSLIIYRSAISANSTIYVLAPTVTTILVNETVPLPHQTITHNDRHESSSAAETTSTPRGDNSTAIVVEDFGQRENSTHAAEPNIQEYHSQQEEVCIHQKRLWTEDWDEPVRPNSNWRPLLGTVAAAAAAAYLYVADDEEARRKRQRIWVPLNTFEPTDSQPRFPSEPTDGQPRFPYEFHPDVYDWSLADLLSVVDGSEAGRDWSQWNLISDDGSSAVDSMDAGVSSATSDGQTLDQGSIDQTDSDHHPMVSQYLSKLGDIDLLQERLEEIEEEKYALEEGEVVRRRYGIEIPRENQEGMNTLNKTYSLILEDLRCAEEVLQELKQQCLLQELIDENGEPTDMAIPQYYTQRVVDDGILVPDISDMSGPNAEGVCYSINQWLLEEDHPSLLGNNLLQNSLESRLGNWVEHWVDFENGVNELLGLAFEGFESRLHSSSIFASHSDETENKIGREEGCPFDSTELEAGSDAEEWSLDTTLAVATTPFAEFDLPTTTGKVAYSDDIDEIVPSTIMGQCETMEDWLLSFIDLDFGDNENSQAWSRTNTPKRTLDNSRFEHEKQLAVENQIRLCHDLHIALLMMEEDDDDTLKEEKALSTEDEIPTGLSLATSTSTSELATIEIYPSFGYSIMQEDCQHGSPIAVADQSVEFSPTPTVESQTPPKTTKNTKTHACDYCSRRYARMGDLRFANLSSLER